MIQLSFEREVPVRDSYSLRSKVIHWTIAFLVFALLLGGFQLDDMPLQTKKIVLPIHKSIGLTVLGLMLFRVYCIVKDGRPNLPVSTPKWEIYLARIVQYSFYIFLIAMPFSGWIMSIAAGYPPSYFGLITLHLPFLSKNSELARTMFSLHKNIAIILICLIFFHLAGNAKHYFWNKDNVVQKMLLKK